MKIAGLPAVVLALLSLTVLGAQSPAPRTFPKHVLAWADVRNGYQHESITHALSTIERLGWESGLYDTIIRTDSQSITKSPILFKQGTGIAANEQFLARNLNYFDAIFFFGVREIDLDAQQRADLLSFVRDDGKGFVATHAGSTAFFSWPEFGEMLGGRFDEHPWGISEATVVVEDRSSPMSRHLPASFTVTDEHYQLKDFSRQGRQRHRASRCGQARSQGAAGASHRSRLRRRLYEDLRQGPRVLFDAGPPARAVGHRVAAEDVLRSAEVVDGLEAA